MTCIILHLFFIDKLGNWYRIVLVLNQVNIVSVVKILTNRIVWNIVDLWGLLLPDEKELSKARHFYTRKMSLSIGISTFTLPILRAPDGGGKKSNIEVWNDGKLGWVGLSINFPFNITRWVIILVRNDLWWIIISYKM